MDSELKCDTENLKCEMGKCFPLIIITDDNVILLKAQ